MPPKLTIRYSCCKNAQELIVLTAEYGTQGQNYTVCGTNAIPITNYTSVIKESDSLL